jgi:hypothetical protein
MAMSLSGRQCCSAEPVDINFQPTTISIFNQQQFVFSRLSFSGTKLSVSKRKETNFNKEVLFIALMSDQRIRNSLLVTTRHPKFKLISVIMA